MVQPGKHAETILSLESKISIADTVISDAFSNFKRPAVIWSTGKDSTVMLHRVREYLKDQNGIIFSIFIDHGMHYPETIKMLNDIGKEWKLKVISAKNDDVLNNIDNDGYIHVNKLTKENQLEIKSLGYNGDKFPFFSNVIQHFNCFWVMHSVINKYRKNNTILVFKMLFNKVKHYS